MELFVDTETSGMVLWGADDSDPNQPWIVQLGAILSEKDMVYAELNLLIQPDGRKIDSGAYNAHGISTKMCEKGGVPEEDGLLMLSSLWSLADTVVCHNVGFDFRVLHIASLRYDIEIDFGVVNYCTMIMSTDLCKIPHPAGGYKWPKLQELHEFLFKERFVGAHDAMEDIRATRRCFYKMMEMNDGVDKLQS